MAKSFCLSKHSHYSTSEANDCNRLLADLQSGKIKAYKFSKSIDLHIDGKLWKRWKVDFLVTEKDGSEVLFESKGWNRSDESCMLKLAAFLTEYPAWPIYMGTHNYNLRRRAELSPGLRVLYSGIKSRKRRAQQYKTWDRRLGKYVVVKLDHKRNAYDRKR